jgi:purine-cytosine permease-like protein
MRMTDETKREEELRNEEDVYAPISDKERIPWPSMLMSFIGTWVSLYSVAIGYSIGMQLDVKLAILSCVVGYAIAGVIGALVGEIGRKTGLASYVLAQGPLSWFGMMLLTLMMFTVISFGSLGVQADTVGRSLGELVPSLTPYRVVISGLTCALMMVTSIVGMKLMTKFAWVSMPLFFIVTVIATIIAVNQCGGLGAALAIKHNEMTFSRAVFLNAGAWGGFIMLMSDISRFLRKRSEVFTVIPLAFIIGSIPPICGVLLGGIVGKPLEALFPALGIGVLGFIAIFGAGWATNDNNAYTAGLALSTALYQIKRVRRSRVTMVVGALGVIGAMTGIGQLRIFEWLANFHGSFNMAFVGVLLAHYYVVSKDRFVQTNGLAGLLSWLLIGILCYVGILPVPYITATVLTFILYLALYYGVEKPMFGEREVKRFVPYRLVRAAGQETN